MNSPSGGSLRVPPNYFLFAPKDKRGRASVKAKPIVRAKNNISLSYPRAHSNSHFHVCAYSPTPSLSPVRRLESPLMSSPLKPLSPTLCRSPLNANDSTSFLTGAPDTHASLLSSHGFPPSSSPSHTPNPRSTTSHSSSPSYSLASPTAESSRACTAVPVSFRKYPVPPPSRPLPPVIPLDTQRQQEVYVAADEVQAFTRSFFDSIHDDLHNHAVVLPDESPIQATMLSRFNSHEKITRNSQENAISLAGILRAPLPPPLRFQFDHLSSYSHVKLRHDSRWPYPAGFRDENKEAADKADEPTTVAQLDVVSDDGDAVSYIAEDYEEAPTHGFLIISECFGRRRNFTPAVEEQARLFFNVSNLTTSQLHSAVDFFEDICGLDGKMTLKQFENLPWLPLTTHLCISKSILFSFFDRDQDELLDCDEFVQAVCQLVAPTTRQLIILLFRGMNSSLRRVRLIRFEDLLNFFVNTDNADQEVALVSAVLSAIDVHGHGGISEDSLAQSVYRQPLLLNSLSSFVPQLATLFLRRSREPGEGCHGSQTVSRTTSRPSSADQSRGAAPGGASPRDSQPRELAPSTKAGESQMSFYLSSPTATGPRESVLLSLKSADRQSGTQLFGDRRASLSPTPAGERRSSVLLTPKATGDRRGSTLLSPKTSSRSPRASPRSPKASESTGERRASVLLSPKAGNRRGSVLLSPKPNGRSPRALSPTTGGRRSSTLLSPKDGNGRGSPKTGDRRASTSLSPRPGDRRSSALLSPKAGSRRGSAVLSPKAGSRRGSALPSPKAGSRRGSALPSPKADVPQGGERRGSALPSPKADVPQGGERRGSALPLPKASESSDVTAATVGTRRSSVHVPSSATTAGHGKRLSVSFADPATLTGDAAVVAAMAMKAATASTAFDTVLHAHYAALSAPSAAAPPEDDPSECVTELFTPNGMIPLASWGGLLYCYRRFVQHAESGYISQDGFAAMLEGMGFGGRADYGRELFDDIVGTKKSEFDVKLSHIDVFVALAAVFNPTLLGKTRFVYSLYHLDALGNLSRNSFLKRLQAIAERQRRDAKQSRREARKAWALLDPTSANYVTFERFLSVVEAQNTLRELVLWMDL